MAHGIARGAHGAGPLAGLLWPADRGVAPAWRNAALVALGSALLTLSAKVAVPGPVPMTLQTLALMALGATLGGRLAVLSVLVYLGQGALGLPVFGNTPPLASGLPYLLGPTGGFLAGFLVLAGLVGLAADRGVLRRPVLFAAVLAGATALLMALGWAYLAFGAQVGSGTGIGAARAFQVGVLPFLPGEVVKVLIAALGLPLVHAALGRLLGR